MALRQIEIYLSESADPFPSLDDEFSIVDRHDLTLQSGARLVRILADTTSTDALLEWLQEKAGADGDYRIVITAVTATLPRSETPEEDEEEDEKSGTSEAPRISREEVIEEVNDSLRTTSVHYTLVGLSTIVATGGMLRDSPAIVIGAMVIAPLIGPNIALALGTTLADFQLIRRSLIVNGLGLLLALVLATLGGFLLPVDLTVAEIASRTEVNIGDIALALAAGVAGVLSVTRGVSTALIGVMVAVALLPPLVAVGLCLGAQDYSGAFGAAMLTLTNIVAINLAGIITFLVQGLRPTSWYEEEKARKTRLIAALLWLLVLAALISSIFISPLG